MNPDDYAKFEKMMSKFFDDNEEMFIPDDEITEIIRLVKTETEEDLLRVKLNVILQSFANKIAKWKNQEEN